MYGDLSLQHQMISQTGSLSGSEARRTAAAQFWTARLSGVAHSFIARLSGKAQHLNSLSDAVTGKQVKARRYLGLRSVPLAQIQGSEGRSRDFDANYRPVANHIRDRWIGIASARMRGVSLPPVELVQVGDSYFVRDGNHRISVAHHMGQSEIDALVTLWEMA